jgi:hypothetical protein
LGFAGARQYTRPQEGEMRARITAALLLGLVAVSCHSSPPGEKVSCEWFAGESCWKSSLDAAAACAIDSSLEGTLSADGLTCSFADGSEVHFGAPIDLANMEGNDVDLEIIRSGESCLTFTNRDGEGFHLTTSLGTFSETGQFTLVVTCPDGTPVHADSLEILQCENALGILPGSGHTWSSSSFSYRLMNGRDGDVVLFSCSKP